MFFLICLYFFIFVEEDFFDLVFIDCEFDEVDVCIIGGGFVGFFVVICFK